MPDVDLWYVRTGDVNDERTLRACAALMREDERVTHDAFKFDRHRHEYLVTRALVRAVLGKHLTKTPSELTFVRNEHGRPELPSPSTTRFNVTNTTALVACAVVSDREIGVDAEPLARGDDIVAIATTVFTSHEREMLGQLEIDARRRRAVELWTIKEAYIKARGLGMALPVDRLEAIFAADGASLRFLEPLVDDPGRWSLVTHEIEEHLVSLCVERRERDAKGIVVKLHQADLTRML